MLTKSLRCISTKLQNFLYYYGLEDINLFLDNFERDVLKEQWFQALDIALQATLARWWGMHKDNFIDWKEYQ